MHCVFLKNDQVASVEALTAGTEKDAIEFARKKFEAHKWDFDGFEVWDSDRLIYEFPEPLKTSAKR